MLTLAAAVGACSGDDAAPPDSTTPTVVSTVPDTQTSDGVLTIGVLLPFTGQGAASLGAPMSAAIRDAVADINAAGGVLGRSVALVQADEASSGGLAELVENGVDAVVGPASSLVALSDLGTAMEAGVVVCSPTATAIALDDYPDTDGLFFRTVPSDSLQMEAIVRQVRDTGFESVSVVYLDDPYGRGLANAFEARVNASTVLTLDAQVGFSGDVEDLSDVAEQVADSQAIVVLGDADDGGRVLTALDAVVDAENPPAVIVNDAVRSARQPIAQLSTGLRERLVGVAPRSQVADQSGYFTANAIDCVNLIALAATQAGSDQPDAFRGSIAAVSYGGSPCSGYAECAQRLTDVPQIDYTGLSGPVDLRGLRGDLSSAYFDVFRFDENGSEIDRVEAAVAL